jgi:hypothetical protein
VPSLDLRFADNKSLVDAVTGQQLVTHTRAGSGTFTDSAGTLQTAATDVPRFDHNPTTGESLGLLVEEARTNLLLRSEEFDNAVWTKVVGAITVNNATAPDGTSTADTFIPTAATGLAYFQQIPTVVATNTYTWSIFLKASGYTWVFLDLFDGTNRRSYFNLTGAGTVGTVAAGNTSTITALGNGWYRCTLTRAPANTSPLCAVAVTSGDNIVSVTYNGTSGVHAWGAQLEAGAFPTSYIATTTAAATRAADVVSITGSAFSSWYSQSEGTIYYDGTVSQGLAAFPWFYNITDGTINNSIGTYQHTSGIYGTLSTGGTAITPDASVLFTPVSGAAAKHALAVKTSDTRAAYNGTLSAAQTTTVMPVVNQLAIGQRVTGNRMTGTIRRFTFWPQRLPNSTLQSITQ